MPPKRKATQKAPSSRAPNKRRKKGAELDQVVDATPLTRNDLAELVKSITEKVTQQVTANLANAAVPTPQEGNSSVAGVDQGKSSDSDTVSVTPVLGSNQVIAQETPITTQTVPKYTSSLSSISLYAHVDEKIRAKIWAGEFVELSKLFNNSADDSYVLSVVNGSGQPTISLKPRSEGKIYSIERWTKAFQIYMAILTLKQPEQAPNLLKYCDVVRDLAIKGYNWRMYDDSFRRMRETDPVPWEQVIMELWVKAAHSRSAHMNNSLSVRDNVRPFREDRNYNSFHENRERGSFSQRQGDMPRFPKGVCFKYHSGKHCAGCNFSHQCFKCQDNHPFVQCGQRKAGGQSTTTWAGFNHKSIPKSTPTSSAFPK